MNRISRAVCLFSVISLVRSAAISDTSPAFTPISTPLESDPAGTPTDTGFPTTPDPTPTDPGTGGFLLVGVYTTCLTLTFAGPTGDPFSDPSSASVTDSVITVDAASSGATSRTVPVGTVTHVPERAHRHRSRTQSLSQIPTDFPLTTSSDSDPFPGGTADPQPTPTSADPDPDPTADPEPDPPSANAAVFSTCLVFLPTSTTAPPDGSA